MPTHFTPAGLRFLKQLKTHNDRDWFNEHKSTFEQEVQGPWLLLLDEINAALAEFAPDYVKPARKAALRIYRDIRFSKSKLPYKTHVAAWWSTTTQVRTSGGGFYAHVGADEVIVAAGVYQPQPDQLLAIRRHLQQHHAELRALLADRQRRRLLPEFDSNPLTRMPKGFAPETLPGTYSSAANGRCPRGCRASWRSPPSCCERSCGGFVEQHRWCTC